MCVDGLGMSNNLNLLKNGSILNPTPSTKK